MVRNIKASTVTHTKHFTLISQTQWASISLTEIQTTVEFWNMWYYFNKCNKIEGKKQHIYILGLCAQLRYVQYVLVKHYLQFSRNFDLQQISHAYYLKKFFFNKAPLNQIHLFKTEKICFINFYMNKIMLMTCSLYDLIILTNYTTN